MAGSLFRPSRSIAFSPSARATGEGTLKRTLVTVVTGRLGIGAIIGAGLFVRTAAAIADRAGPSVTLAFIVAGVGCAFAGLCYAEFASMIPVAGSAYTYSYATMGEFVAWIIGWDLVLEYAVGAATVAIAWSEYSTGCWNGSGCASRTNGRTRRSRHRRHRHPGDHEHSRRWSSSVPALDAADPRHAGVGVRQRPDRHHQGRDRPDGDRDRLGVHQSGEPHAADSGADDLPRRRASTHTYGGIMGILGAAGVVFFAYIGFDAVSTAAQEAEEPEARHADRHPRLAGRSARSSTCCSPTC